MSALTTIYFLRKVNMFIIGYYSLIFCLGEGWGWESFGTPVLDLQTLWRKLMISSSSFSISSGSIHGFSKSVNNQERNVISYQAFQLLSGQWSFRIQEISSYIIAFVLKVLSKSILLLLAALEENGETQWGQMPCQDYMGSKWTNSHTRG